MNAASTWSRWRSGRRFRGALRWGALFLGLLLAIWAATLSASAPQSILVLVLYVLAINFGAPPGRASAVVIPVIGLSSFFVLGYQGAMILAVFGSLVAELAHPLWAPLWHRTGRALQSRVQRLGSSLVAIAALAGAGAVYRQYSPQPPIAGIDMEALAPLARLAISYGLLFVLGNGAVRALSPGGQSQPWWDFGANILVAGLLSQPFAYLGALTYGQFGLPAFAIFGLAIGAYAIVSGLSWQHQYIMEQQLGQFAALNRVGRSMRETLDLTTVLARTYEQVIELVPADQFTIALVRDTGAWEQPFHVSAGQLAQAPPANTDVRGFPDGFTRWVAERGRVLELGPDDMHLADQHHIAGPQPLPAYWLGVPLTTATRVIGAMTLQRDDPLRPFSSWSREVLVAVAGQASAAIENARLYTEVVRLLNLTDEALRRRVDQLQALLDTVQEAVLMLDAQGRVLLVNRRATSLLAPDLALRQGQGPTLEELAPRLGYESGELPRLLSDLATTSLPKEQRQVFERIGRDEAGRQRFLERVEAPVIAVDGAPIGWLMVFRDVTEERELTERRQDVTRMIVHDLRNPVTTILSTLSRMERAPLDPVGLAMLVDRARRSGRNLLDMIDSLMDIQRLEAGRLVVDAEAMRLPALLSQVVDYLQPMAVERGITLQITPHENVPAVWADAALLRRVLINLLDNALKFTSAGGHIVVELTAAETPLPEHEPGVRCTITDDGPGVPPEHREWIFDRYTRLDAGGSQVRGTGLGLTFCKLAMEAQNGAIWVEDAPERGSRFVFTLPGIPRF